MRLKSLLVGLICVSLTFSGCASTANFSNTPVEESEFHKDLDYLRSKYSDIDEYDRTFASPKSAPRKNELVQMWGEPHTEKKWGEYGFNIVVLGGWMAVTGLPLATMLIWLNSPYPQERYVWNKGDYLISAEGRNDSFAGYEKRIHSWEWKRKDASIKYAEDVKMSGEVMSH